jgi:NAD(P)-dependent dehydrogenase (short-subunit alcohol dehydrogenase family)
MTRSDATRQARKSGQNGLKIVILGATKGMGRALARRLIETRADPGTGEGAERRTKLVLLGREREDLERSARDLEVRGDREAGAVGTAVCDLADRASFAPALDAAQERLGGLDAVVVTAADFGVQDGLEADPARTERLLDTNVTGTILFCEEARRRLLEQVKRGEQAGRGVLCVFSSVAGDRARKPVVLYGASKAALSYYLEGLDRRFWSRGLRVVTVKPGFVKTSMTAGLDPPPFAGEPDQVAGDVAKAIDRAARGRAGVVYTPWPWRWIMLVIRNLPGAVMRRIGF